MDLTPQQNTGGSTLDGLVRELDVLIRARYPLLAVTTHEEQRFRRIIAALAGTERHRKKGLYWWSRIQGLCQIGGPGSGAVERPISETRDPQSVLEHIAADDGEDGSIYVLADYGRFIAPFAEDEALRVRRLRELAWQIKATRTSVLFVGPTFPEQPDLQKEVKVVDLPLPDEREVAELLDLQLDRLARNREVRLNVDGHAHGQLVQALLGLTETEVENALAKAAIALRGIGPDAVPLILDEKRSVIRQSGSLTYTHPESADHLGGYAHLRSLLEEVAVTFTPAARAYGVEPMKGVLLVGLPGTGKDLTKRIASSILGRPLLDLDFGSVMGEGGGVIGSASQSIKRALSIASTLKGILGISEFEKAVSGLESSARSDAGETARTIAFLLNWMGEQDQVFVVATANDVRALAPEQLRQGRFSHVVFVDLPGKEDRADIFRVHLARRGRDPGAFDLEQLADAAEGFSGAEIEGAVKAGLLDAFRDGGRELATADVLGRVKRIRPTSEVKREQIEELRKWAREHLAIDAVKGQVVGGERRLEF